MGIRKSTISTQEDTKVDFDELTTKASESLFISQTQLSPVSNLYGSPSYIHTEDIYSNIDELDDPNMESSVDDRLGMGSLRRQKLNVSSKVQTFESKGTSSKDYFSTSANEDSQSLERLRSLQGMESISSEDFNPTKNLTGFVSKSPASSFSDLTQTGIESLKSFFSKSKSKVFVHNLYLF